MDSTDIITIENVERLIREYTEDAEALGPSLSGLTGIRLLEALKRDVVGVGRYPKVSLFEAANRIMTDLVILNSIRCMLGHPLFPFERYAVEFGHRNARAHDVMASRGKQILIGEAFNVAPSFFPIKRNSALKKLRESTSKPTHRVLMCNREAVGPRYSPKLENAEFLVLVDVSRGSAHVVSKSAC